MRLAGCLTSSGPPRIRETAPAGSSRPITRPLAPSWPNGTHPHGARAKGATRSHASGATLRPLDTGCSPIRHGPAFGRWRTMPDADDPFLQGRDHAGCRMTPRPLHSAIPRVWHGTPYASCRGQPHFLQGSALRNLQHVCPTTLALRRGA